MFFGASDKSHLLLVLGKLLTAMERKVLIVDSTLAQSMQGYLPRADFGYSLREFEGIDVATGSSRQRNWNAPCFKPEAKRHTMSCCSTPITPNL